MVADSGLGWLSTVELQPQSQEMVPLQASSPSAPTSRPVTLCSTPRPPALRNVRVVAHGTAKTQRPPGAAARRSSKEVPPVSRRCGPRGASGALWDASNVQWQGPVAQDDRAEGPPARTPSPSEGRGGRRRPRAPRAPRAPSKSGRRFPPSRLPGSIPTRSVSGTFGPRCRLRRCRCTRRQIDEGWSPR